MEDCGNVREIVKLCKQIEDDLEGLDALEKKTEILKAQVLALTYQQK
jgi:hypothetical protein